MIFYKQFPQYASSVEARFQFYQMNWKTALEEMIDKELILADAEENKLPISQGDIRQEMEELFGPHIIANLDKAGLTLEEASQMVKEDLIIQRMLSLRVHSKAIRTVTPQKIRLYYETWAKKNRKPDLWKYQVISFRGENSATCAEIANYAHSLLTKEQVAISSLEEKLQEHLLGKEIHLTISELFEHTPDKISDTYKEGLLTLKPDSFSTPLFQKSRSGKVFRLFYLKEKIQGGAAPLQEVENILRDELARQGSQIEAEAYMKKLHKHFAIQQFIENQSDTETFQPFFLDPV